MLQTTNGDLVQQLATARRPTQGDSQEIRTLLSRAVNAEKRLVVANNQLLQHEEKISTLNQKTSTADAKWETRVKEYEARLKVAEEKYKRERQGGKERILELDNQIKYVICMLFFIAFFAFTGHLPRVVIRRSLERQNEIAHKRNVQLDAVTESARTGGSGRGHR
jgi:chromosome segregation ATPase